MKSCKTYKSELLKNNDIKKEYDTLSPRYQLISQVIKARKKKGFTQADLAKKIGTKQSAIARMESGNINPTVGFLEKIAEALDSKLQIQFK